MPALDLDRHHQQLGEDERGEGDAHHVHEALLEEHDPAQHDDATLRGEYAERRKKYDIIFRFSLYKLNILEPINGI